MHNNGTFYKFLWSYKLKTKHKTNGNGNKFHNLLILLLFSISKVQEEFLIKFFISKVLKVKENIIVEMPLISEKCILVRKHWNSIKLSSLLLDIIVFVENFNFLWLYILEQSMQTVANIHEVHMILNQNFAIKKE